jgi:hypothetical protein
MDCLSFEDFVRRTGRSLKSVAQESMIPGALVPTLCKHGCEVELRERCPHGCLSIVVELMVAGYRWNEVLSQGETPKTNEREWPSASG